MTKQKRHQRVSKKGKPFRAGSRLFKKITPEQANKIIRKKVYQVAKRLVKGKGFDPKNKTYYHAPGYPNPSKKRDKPIIGAQKKPEQPAQAMVITGFYLLGPSWPQVYKTIGLKDNLWKAYDQLEKEFK